MTSRWPLTRRQFLVLCAAFGTPLAPDLIRATRAARGSRTDPAVERLRAVVARTSAARSVGRAYVAAYSSEATTAVLLGAIQARLPRSLDWGPLTTDADDRLRVALQRAIAEDFSIENVVFLNGWMLSRTEARVCGLVALL